MQIINNRQNEKYGTWTVTYNANGGTGDNHIQTVEKGNGFYLRGKIFTRTGYTLESWNTNSNGFGTRYEVDAWQPTLTSDLTLYAIWKSDSPQLETYTVTYNANGGTNAPNPEIVYVGSDVNLSRQIPTRQNYIFKGWSIVQNGNPIYQPGDLYQEQRTITLYAVWEAEQIQNPLVWERELSSQYDSGSNSYLVTGTIKTTDRYNLINYYYEYVDNNRNDSDNPSLIYTNTNSQTFQKRIPTQTYDQYYHVGCTVRTGDSLKGRILIPKITQVVTYTVTYDANGGTNAPSSQIKEHDVGLQITDKIPTKQNCTFLGWSVIRNGNPVYQPGGYYLDNANITLYAVWRENTTSYYTITYNANGGENAPSSQRKEHGITIQLSNQKPTRANHEFLYWTEEQILGGNYITYNPGDYYFENKNLILYAQWKRLSTSSWTLSYDANGGSAAPSSQSAAQNTSITISNTIPTKDGCDFIGWSRNRESTSAEYHGGDRITSSTDITLYAVWRERQQPQPQNKNMYIGTDAIGSISLGTNKIGKIYLGNIQVW